MSDSECDVVVVSDTWTEQHVIRHVARTLKNETTFSVLNVQDLIDKVMLWKEKMPRVTPYYAVKCHYHPVIIEVLAALGLRFDCASLHEMEFILSAGVQPERIIYAHTIKPRPHLLYARQHGIDLMTFDCDMELLKIKQYYPNAKLLIRIRCDGKIVAHNLGIKFGCEAQDEAPLLLQIAKDLNLQVVGVAFHVGSLCLENDAYKRGIKIAKQLFGIGQTLGHYMHILDIGGGFPGNKESPIDKIFENVSQAIDDYFPIGEDVEIIAEPGRYFIATAFTLASCIHSVKRPKSHMEGYSFKNNSSVINYKQSQIKQNIKRSGNYNITKELMLKSDCEISLKNDCTSIDQYKLRPDNENIDSSKGTIMYFLDNGLHCSLKYFYLEYVNHEGFSKKVQPLEAPTTDDKIWSSLWGPTCDGDDCIFPRILLPALPVPSWMVFHGYGAYSPNTSSFFNGFAMPTDHAYASQKTWAMLSKLPHIKMRRRLRPVMAPHEIPRPYTFGKQMLPHLHINDYSSHVTKPCSDERISV